MATNTSLVESSAISNHHHQTKTSTTQAARSQEDINSTKIGAPVVQRGRRTTMTTGTHSDSCLIQFLSADLVALLGASVLFWSFRCPGSRSSSVHFPRDETYPFC
eukprot:scaffold579_cov231-Chaetoceros_neogracile.AAC.8